MRAEWSLNEGDEWANVNAHKPLAAPTITLEPAVESAPQRRLLSALYCCLAAEAACVHGQAGFNLAVVSASSRRRLFSRSLLLPSRVWRRQQSSARPLAVSEPTRPANENSALFICKFRLPIARGPKIYPSRRRQRGKRMTPTPARPSLISSVSFETKFNISNGFVRIAGIKSPAANGPRGCDGMSASAMNGREKLSFSPPPPLSLEHIQPERLMSSARRQQGRLLK